MLIAALPLAVWFLYSGYVFWRYPTRRRPQMVKACLWLAVVACACALHRYYHVSARAEADRTVQAVSAYKRAHGTYPDRLEDAGVTFADYGGRWHIGYVVDKDRKRHSLVYPATFFPFEAYIYEFEEARWVYLPD